MARLIIEDLTEDTELDAQAMKAVSGGNRLQGSAASRLERRYRAGAKFEESNLVPGLIRTGSLRER